MKTLRNLAVLSLLTAAPVAWAFQLTSPDIKAGAKIDNKHVFKGFGCEGGNISPALEWKDPPKGTKSFALMVYDPDAPTGSGWWHWVMFNIPADATKLEQGVGDPLAGKMPKGAVQSRTDFGKPGWGGPCPPAKRKPHRYIFTLHALTVDKIDADENSSAALVGFMVNANSLGKASFTGLYNR